MTVFRPGMRVKRIFSSELNKATETDYIGRITTKGFIKLQGDLKDPYKKHWLIRPDGSSAHGSFYIVPDHDDKVAELNGRKRALLQELESITLEISLLEQEMEAKPKPKVVL